MGDWRKKQIFEWNSPARYDATFLRHIFSNRKTLNFKVWYKLSLLGSFMIFPSLRTIWFEDLSKNDIFMWKTMSAAKSIDLIFRPLIVIPNETVLERKKSWWYQFRFKFFYRSDSVLRVQRWCLAMEAEISEICAHNLWDHVYAVSQCFTILSLC